ncbi:MAG: ATP-binding protein [Arenibacter algicola]|nr:ATP-binding protein [Arenibacter algicola]
MMSIVIEKHQLPSELASMARVEQLIDELKEKHQIPEELYGNLLVATTEAVNNAIKHGNQMQKDRLIDLNFELSDAEYSVVIKDQGPGFDYENVPDPTLPENIEKPDGRGIFIMKNLSDEVEFEDNGSMVRLKFNR